MLLGLLIAVFIGIGLVAKEVERRSIYSLLSSRSRASSSSLGKFVGLVMTLAVNLAAMVLAFYAVLFYQRLTVPPAQQAQLAGAGDGSAAADCGRPDVRRADDRDRDRAVLFHVLRPAAHGCC